jgi:hypothetical protein
MDPSQEVRGDTQQFPGVPQRRHDGGRGDQAATCGREAQERLRGAAAEARMVSHLVRMTAHRRLRPPSGSPEGDQIDITRARISCPGIFC